MISATTTLTTQLCLRMILLPVLFLPQRSLQKQSAGIQQHGLGFKEQLAFLQRACPSMYSCRRLQNSCYSRNLLSDSRRLSVENNPNCQTLREKRERKEKARVEYESARASEREREREREEPEGEEDSGTLKRFSRDCHTTTTTTLECRSHQAINQSARLVLQIFSRNPSRSGLQIRRNC